MNEQLESLNKLAAFTINCSESLDQAKSIISDYYRDEQAAKSKIASVVETLTECVDINGEPLLNSAQTKTASDYISNHSGAVEIIRQMAEHNKKLASALEEIKKNTPSQMTYNVGDSVKKSAFYNNSGTSSLKQQADELWQAAISR